MRVRVLAVTAALVAAVVSGGAAHARTSAGAPAKPTVVTSGLAVPWAVAWLPGARSALVTERDNSRVWLVTRSGRKVDLGVVPESRGAGGEDGLLGAAVSPTWNGSSDRSVYFLHTAADETRVVRMSFDGARLSGYTPIVRGIGKHLYHNGGRLAFGPDGYLYAAVGDLRQPRLAQDPSSLNGKILRFTTAGAPAPGNPFGTLVYSMGHRDPQGLAWDSAGRLWSAELGQDAFDELNLVEPGGNYGWPVCEGVCADARYTNPKATWAPAEASPSGIAIVDDTVYMGALRGQRLWTIELWGTRTGEITPYFQGTYGRIRAVSAVPGERAIWLTTSNSDSFGGRPAGMDRILAAAITG
jgi:glucose/arabinose dehydrogenase